MTSKLMMAVSASALALAACGQRDNEAGDDVNVAVDNGVVVDNGMMADADAALPTSAQGFANTAAASDRFEIESSRLAATQGQSAAIKSYAEKMISAHQDSTAKLKTTVSGLNPPVTPDDTLSAAQQADLDGLKGKTGAEFDTAYAAAQVKAHQAALDALNAYAASGDTPALKEFASGLVPTVTAHLNMAKGLR
jgi:putative membrane protein